MEYKGYTIEISEPTPSRLLALVLYDDEIITWSGYFDDDEKAIKAAKRVIDKLPQKPNKNPYTPNNRPPYMWIKPENDLPNDWSHVLAIWTDGTHKMLAKSYCSVGWTCLEYPQLNNGDWYVIYWQYMPALPE